MISSLLRIGVLACSLAGAMALDPSSRPTTDAPDRTKRLLDFNGPEGAYTSESFYQDTGGSVPAGRDFASITEGRLRVAFKEGKKVTDTGFSGHIPVPARQHYTLATKIRFPNDFETGLHGKQLGLSGGKGYDGGRGEEARLNGDGWSIRLQFDSKPDAVHNTLYVYHADMTTKYGGPVGAKPFALQKGRWHALRLGVTMNSAIDRSDGRIQVWCDEDLKIDVTNIRFARVESGRQIDRIRLEVFPGGGGAFPSADTCIEFDDFEWNDGQ